MDPVVIVMKRTQTCVLRRKASSGCDVNDETSDIGEIGQRHTLTLKRQTFKVVKGRHDSEASGGSGAGPLLVPVRKCSAGLESFGAILGGKYVGGEP